MTTTTLIGKLSAARFAESLQEAATFGTSAPERHLEAIAASRDAVAASIQAVTK